MSGNHIQDILPLVDGPSRYLGNEVNAVHKDLAAMDLTVALAFPDLYEIGSSHFGMQILYHVLNREPNIAAERVFAPAEDMEAQLRRLGIPLLSLESRRPLKGFDIVGFSLLYELNYTNILTMLELAGIPFFSRERGRGVPLVIAGGPCTCNPEPLAEFFDAMVVGDGEETLPAMVRRCIAWKKEGSGEREELLREWSRIPGVYVPAFFTPAVVDGGSGRLAPRFPDYTTVKRAVVADLEAAPFPEEPVVPFGRPVHDRLRLEIARGCTRGCRFCQAGMLYRPVRERSPDGLLGTCRRSLERTGYGDVSLLSLSTGDYRCIGALMERMMGQLACDRVAVSLPSLRAGTLTPAMMELIKSIRKTGFTIAPEAGSQRLRDVINKNISREDIHTTVRDAFDSGWQVIKLYFMIGLPSETPEDLEALVELVQSLRRLRGRGARRGQINVSVATFIPKAHTPFQWAAQLPLEESRRRIGWLQERLRQEGLQLKWQNPEASLLEGLWARGDRRLAPLLLEAYRRGCRFDGWSDRFRFDLWQTGMESLGIDPHEVVYKERDLQAPLPWDHIDIGVTRAFLLEEWSRAQQAEATPDCRDGDCQACGVCDFRDLRPRVYEGFAGAPAAPMALAEAPDGRTTLRLRYRKTGPARFLGHLEMANVFQRALQRARVGVAFSEGFHPKPRLAFEDALPVGMESLDEGLRLVVQGAFDLPSLVRNLNRELPEGLVVEDGQRIGKDARSKGPRRVLYQVHGEDGAWDPSRLQAFEEAEQMPMTSADKKGRPRHTDLKRAVCRVRPLGASTLEITIQEEDGGRQVRPGDFLHHVLGLEGEALKRVHVIKLRSSAAGVQPPDAEA